MQVVVAMIEIWLQIAMIPEELSYCPHLTRGRARGGRQMRCTLLHLWR